MGRQHLNCDEREVNIFTKRALLVASRLDKCAVYEIWRLKRMLSICIYIQIDVCMYSCTYIHVHIHTCMHTYRHIYM